MEGMMGVACGLLEMPLSSVINDAKLGPSVLAKCSTANFL